MHPTMTSWKYSVYIYTSSKTHVPGGLPIYLIWSQMVRDTILTWQQSGQLGQQQTYMLKKRTDTVNIFSRLLLDCIWVNVVKTIINHPPVITILMGGINHQKYGVVYDIVLPTSTHLPIRSSSRLASSLFDVFSAQVYAAFSPDDQHVVSAGINHVAQIWSIEAVAWIYSGILLISYVCVTSLLWNILETKPTIPIFRYF